MALDTPRLAAGADALVANAAANRWRGSDPYDGLSWGWPGLMVAGKRRRQALTQLHARAPVDIRRLYRREPPVIAKSLALFGAAAVRLWQLSGDERHRGLAADALDSLCADRSAGAEAWGYPWDVQTRWSHYPAGSPNIVVTAFSARALHEAGLALGEPRYVERARGAGAWVRKRLFAEPEGWFVYHEGSRDLIHNANLLGAETVHTVLGGDEAVVRALAATVGAQRPDGPWPYGGDVGFVDSFHTGYILTSLCALAGEHDLDGPIADGAAHYASRFFGPNGEARLWPGRRWPEDGHSAGTALSTLAVLAGRGAAERDLLVRVAERVIGAQLRDRHVVHRRYRLGRSTVRYVRWCDAPVAFGLATAAAVLAGGEGSPLGLGAIARKAVR